MHCGSGLLRPRLQNVRFTFPCWLRDNSRQLDELLTFPNALLRRCETDEQCLAAREQTSCVKVAQDPELEHNACRHKPVWPLDWRDWVQVETCNNMFFIVTTWITRARAFVAKSSLHLIQSRTLPLGIRNACMPGGDVLPGHSDGSSRRDRRRRHPRAAIYILRQLWGTCSDSPFQGHYFRRLHI